MARLLAPIDYLHKSTPYAHQQEAFLLSRDLEYFGLLMEQGTGKSKVILDTAAWLYQTGRIDMLLVVAPNGVHRNWISDEVPAHLPDHIPRLATYYKATPNAKERKALDKLFDVFGGLKVLAVNIESLSREKSPSYTMLKKMLLCHRCLFVVDESSRIKNVSAACTKNILKLGTHATYRRILSGTPITNSPFDLFSQFKFLDPYILKYTSYTSFKHHFGVWQSMPVNNKRGFYDKLVEYKNMDELKQLIAPHIFRVTKAECLDLPPKVFQTVYCDMRPNQRRMYNEIMDELAAHIDPGVCIEDALAEGVLDGTVGAKNGLGKLLRLRQVLGGFVTDLVSQSLVVDTHNPKIDALLDILTNTTDKVIVWACFVAEIEAIKQAVQATNIRCVCYYGDVSQDGRHEAKHSFQNDADVRVFIGNPHSAGIGVTLTAATQVVWFSKDFSVETYLQANDRAHRIGQSRTVVYTDLCFADTVDVKISAALKQKQIIADSILVNKT